MFGNDDLVKLSISIFSPDIFAMTFLPTFAFSCLLIKGASTFPDDDRFGETTLSDLPEDVYTRLAVVPKLIPNAPQDWCDVTFPTGTKFNKGTMVAAKAIRRRPTVTWKGEPDALYCVVMFGVNKYINKLIIFPDLILLDFYLHWIVVNVPGNQLAAPENKISSGVEWFEFLKPLIPPYTVTHRYVVLVFKQNQTLPDNGTAIYGEGFANFTSLQNFIHNQTLISEPVCGNLCVIRT